MNGRARIVCRRPDGNWAQQRLDADRTASVHAAPREAQQDARTQLLRSGGGEFIMQIGGRTDRAKDAVATPVVAGAQPR